MKIIWCWDFNVHELFLFNWRIKAFQGCAGFCCTAISRKFTCSPSLFSLPSHPHPAPWGHHKGRSWAPWAIEQLLTSYLFYMWWYICQCCAQFVPPSSSALRPRVRLLHFSLWIISLQLLDIKLLTSNSILLFWNKSRKWKLKTWELQELQN